MLEPGILAKVAVVDRRGATLRATGFAATVCVERLDRCPASPRAVLLAFLAKTAATA
jgi:hypothetical protein